MGGERQGQRCRLGVRRHRPARWVTPLPGLFIVIRPLPRLLGSAVAACLMAAPLHGQEQGARVGDGLESRKPFAAFNESAERLRARVVEQARGQLGTRYKLGGTRPNVALDCSGLVRYVLGALDVILPRTAASQAKAGVEVEKEIAALRPGDVLTFGRGKRISHVGIYVGDGKMIHASTSRREVVETSLTRRSPLIRQWKGVRRFIDGTTTALRDSALALADSLRN